MLYSCAISPQTETMLNHEGVQTGTPLLHPQNGNMSQRIRIELQHLQEAQLTSWTVVEMAARDSGAGPAFDVDIDRATAYRGDLSVPVMQVLSSEIQAGMLMGLKQADSRDWQIMLVSLGASRGDDDAILSVPSDGFAVAASLAVAHGSGAEDLQADPHGAYQWKLAALELSAG